jgi:dephospho-CoA kinase
MNNNNLTRRFVISIGMFALFSSVSGEPEPNDEEKEEAFMSFKEKLKQLSIDNIEPENDKEKNKEAISRIKDVLRNPASLDIDALFALANAGEADFILLVWAATEIIDLRLMAYLLHVSIRDKVNLDTDFSFKHHAKLYKNEKQRLKEIEHIDTNLSEYGKILATAAQKVNPAWAKIILMGCGK